MGNAGEKPLVSVIVPAHNSQRTIRKCLESIKNQTYKELEIMVVDRHSEDKTTQIAVQFEAKILFVTKERSTAKNLAARKANGEFLLFIDSDMVLSPKTVEECIAKCNETNADAIIIPLQSIGEGLLSRCRKIERESLNSLREYMEAPRFFNRTAFLKTGGFDEKLVCGEDFDLTKRFKKMGNKIDKIQSKISHFEGSPSLYNFLSKAYYYGRTLPALVKKTPKETVKRYTGIRLTSLRTTGLAFKNVWLLSIFIITKTFEFVAYLTGVIVQLIYQFSEKQEIKSLKNKMLTNKFAIVNFTFLTVISVAIFRNFLFSQEWLGGGDVLGFISRSYLYGQDSKWLYIWRPYSFGFVEGINSMDFFMMTFYSIFRDSSATVKAFVFLSYLAAAVSMYLFAHTYTHKHIAALSASLVYILNQWLFSQITEAHVDIIFSYALAPLIFLLFDKALKTGRFKDILFLSLGLSIFLTGFHPECIVIYGVFLTIFAVFFLFFPEKTQDLKTRFYRLLKVSVPSALIVFSLSAFSLVPFLANVRSPYLNPLYEYPLEDAFRCSYANVSDAFTLRAVESWGYVNRVDVYSELGLPDFPVYSFLSVIFLLAYSTLLIRRDRYTIFFAFSTLLSVFVAKGPYPPFGQIFIWMWFNATHFAVFRAASRWIMMAVFSHAFFVSLLVHHLTTYTKNKTYRQMNEKYFKVKQKNARSSKNKKSWVSIDVLNVILKEIHRIIYILSVILLIFSFLGGFLSCFFFFSQGVQVYSLPPEYLAPYEWLASCSDDYKVVTVCRSHAEWNNPSTGESDFSSSGIPTDLGWTHDIGFDSSFIHDKPVFQNGGWDFKARQFVDHLRFRLAREHLTDNLLKLLGPFAYKYLVVPTYTTDKTREFFLNQKGSDNIIYNESAVIVRNDYVAPRMFATDQSMFVMGGLASFDALCKIKDFNLNETTLFFPHTSIEANSVEDRISNRSHMFCFADSNILDLAMISLGEKAEIIYAGNYGASSLNTTKYWTKMPSWTYLGADVLSGGTLTTRGKVKIDLPFELSSNGLYNVWFKLGFASSRGKLSLSVDGEFIQEICPEYPLMSKLTWVNITSLNLAKGKHWITLENDGTGYNDVDAIAIVNPTELKSQMNEITKSLGKFSGRFLYLLEAENTFLNTSVSNWHWTVSPYNGYVIYSNSYGLNVASLASANATSVTDYMEASDAIDGNMCTRWTSEKDVLPQRLELTWKEPQNLSAVQLFFEEAFATDYTIQAWNGTCWINQTTVVGNAESEKIHVFAKPVETSRLRVYVTDFSIHRRVSLWELEAYSVGANSAPAKISIPRKGNYMLSARVGTGPNYGTIYFKVNDDMYSISCKNSVNQFEWHEIGPFNLNVGEHSVSIGGAGLVELDEVLIYSLKDGENHLSINEVFQTSNPEVSVNYERANPCNYQVHVNANETFTLIFSDTYNPLWKAFLDGEEISSTPAYSIVNSFYINKTGKYNIKVYFEGQKYADIGLKFSLLGIISTAIIVLTPKSILNHIKKRILT